MHAGRGAVSTGIMYSGPFALILGADGLYRDCSRCEEGRDVARGSQGTNGSRGGSMTGSGEKYSIHPEIAYASGSHLGVTEQPL